MTTYFLGGIVCPECQALRDGPLPPPGDKWATLINACDVELCARCRAREEMAAVRAEVELRATDYLAHPCRFCDAPVGQPCRTVPYSEYRDYGTGRVQEMPHAARRGKDSGQ